MNYETTQIMLRKKFSYLIFLITTKERLLTSSLSMTGTSNNYFVLAMCNINTILTKREKNRDFFYAFNCFK